MTIGSPFIREARLQRLANGKTRCLTCERRCELAKGQVGWCWTRDNPEGTLYTLIYGAVSSLSCNPTEKKPLHHYGAAGCPTL
jgi:pyruvate formate lyase activating enzyme